MKCGTGKSKTQAIICFVIDGVHVCYIDHTRAMTEKQINSFFCVNTLSKLKGRELIRKQIFVYGYRVFLAGRRICNCHLIANALANTFTVPVIVFNKRLAYLNVHV